MTITYDSIATTTLSSATSTITFSSIPNTFTDLRLVFVCTTNTTQNVFIRLNGDTANNYSSTHLWGDGANPGSGRANNQPYIYATYAGNTSATVPTLWTADIFSYAGNTNKTTLLSQAQDLNGSGHAAVGVALWRSTSAVTSVTITTAGAGTYSIGSTATLYGIKSE